MSYTDGTWDNGSPYSDMEIFIGPDELRTTSGTAALTLNASGDLSVNIGASQATVNVVTPVELIRTGVYGTPQSQFGTAAGVSGPSAVANTSGPLALQPGYPPITAANMATVGGAGILRGPIPKGIQINSLVLNYLITGAALTANQIGITKTSFVNNVAIAVSNILAKATNGLQTATQANPYSTAVAVTAPAFQVTTNTAIILEWDVTTQAGGACRLYGITLKCSFNFN